MKNLDIDKYNKALFFAQKAHQNQKMKYPSDAPYILHCVGVASTALVASENDSTHNLDRNLIAQVALLHDTLEDTSTCFGELKKEFGDSVAKGVLALTKNENLTSYESMQDSINRIKQQPIEIAIVKLADRTFNLRCRVPSWSHEKQLSYIEEGKLILKELGYSSEFLSEKLQSNIDNLTNEIYQNRQFE